MATSLQRIPHATPAQLQRAADRDLWRGGVSGADARFDAARFAEWLEVLVDAGSDVTARQMAALDPDLVVVGIIEHVRVFDAAARASASAPTETAIGGYIVVPRAGGTAQAVLDTLTSLHEEAPALFRRVMRGCVRLSNEGYERDGLHGVLTAREQAMFDLVDARERRREEHGFVSAADARAFLAASGESRRALFRAHVRATGVTATGEPATYEPPPAAADEPPIDAPRALLGAAPTEPDRLAPFQQLLQHALRHDEETAAQRLQELGFLANALAAGCAVQGRPLTPLDASEAAASACNLALEARVDVADTFLVDHDLLELFDEGWGCYRRVCADASARLIDVLTRLECHDRQIERDLVELRRVLSRHHRDGAPWRARDALDVLTQLDITAWAALVGLIAECPVVHGAIPALVERRRGAIDPSAFAFIATRAQIDTVQRFLARLPALLTGS
ncbi:MAG TPA: DUF6178 family protein [Vicinamibacterales bacterium]|nr:DUF6178 family protein [Vicinamibacterales bacterium]